MRVRSRLMSQGVLGIAVFLALGTLAPRPAYGSSLSIAQAPEALSIFEGGTAAFGFTLTTNAAVIGGPIDAVLSPAGGDPSDTDPAFLFPFFGVPNSCLNFSLGAFFGPGDSCSFLVPISTLVDPGELDVDSGVSLLNLKISNFTLNGQPAAPLFRSVDTLTVQDHDPGITPTPVPEPASLLLLGSGLIAARLKRRRTPPRA